MKYSSTKKKRQNHKKKGHSSRTRKGGFFNFFKKKPKTTQEELNDLQKTLQNTSLKNFENMFRREIDVLKSKREQCILNCKKSSLEYKDVELRNQLNSMMDSKSDYEWGNLCANSIKVSNCSDYLKSYKKIEFYKNYLDQINKNTQNLFNNYKNLNESKINNTNSPFSNNNSISSESTLNSESQNQSNSSELPYDSIYSKNNAPGNPPSFFSSPVQSSPLQSSRLQSSPLQSSPLQK